MDSTRVFVTGLPNSLTSKQLQAHFQKQYNVTDAHVLSDRRIGFVGFSDHDTAQHAVRHFNRTYIRMSRISVDLAKPIEVSRGVDGQAVPISQRAQHRRLQQPESRTTPANETNSRKRKRVLQDDGEAARVETATDETTKPIIAQEIDTEQQNQEPPFESREAQQEIEAENLASDTEWLRGKTSRLLDIETPDDVARRQVITQQAEHLLPANDVPNGPEENSSDGQHPEPDSDPLVPNARLFIRNVAFDVTGDQLEAKFGEFGKVQEAHVVVDGRKASSKGMAYIQFAQQADAEEALKAMDGIAFHGRLLHVLPASDKRDIGVTDYELSKMPLKKQKALRRKLEASSASFSWNSLYMNPDAVVSSIANRLGMSKSDILDPTSTDAAVKQAHAETQVIAETKEFLRSRGVQVDAFKNRTRDQRAILLKNFPFGTSEHELRMLLEPFGLVSRFLLPPTGTMAIAEFAEQDSALRALKGLAYKNIKGSVLYLEKAPSGIFDPAIKELSNSSTFTRKASEQPVEPTEGGTAGAHATVFIRNLSFDTTTSRLTEFLNSLQGFKSAKVKTRTDSKRPGQVLSMGFGFAEFHAAADAGAAIAAINGFRLDGHQLVAQPSTKSTDMAEEQRHMDRAKKSDASKTKIIIKNLPFQASRKDIRSLFAQYGQLKTVRVPKKFDNTSRGFAFAEFVTAKEAANAMESLADTHLLGRRLVLDFVEEEAIDAEEQIRATEKKIEQQSNRINLSKLVGTGRRKFNVVSAEDEIP